MSATLATVGDDPFHFFKRNVGIEGNVVQAQVLSPFDYRKQALLYLPSLLPEPNHQDFIASAAEEISRIVEFSRGRAFLLFTSHAALAATYDLLYQSLPYECKKQGEMPRQKLIDWFVSTPNAVLFGTASFWEGVSIDGDKLSCVVIDRIPFQVPDDPIYEARCDLLKQDPEASWFNDLALPHAAMRLKQGVGRLIRTSQDKGIVAILDPRLTRKQYGRRILECLPPMQVIQDLGGCKSLEEIFEHESAWSHEETERPTLGSVPGLG
jgi:ATP-dependent DNA helicase DinG